MTWQAYSQLTRRQLLWRLFLRGLNKLKLKASKTSAGLFAPWSKHFGGGDFHLPCLNLPWFEMFELKVRPMNGST